MYSLLFNVFAQNNPILGIWLCIVIFGLIVAVLSMIYFDHAVIIGSAIAGAYSFVRVTKAHLTLSFREYLSMEEAFPANS
jgi:hypothetical protein